MANRSIAQAIKRPTVVAAPPFATSVTIMRACPVVENKPAALGARVERGSGTICGVAADVMACQRAGRQQPGRTRSSASSVTVASRLAEASSSSRHCHLHAARVERGHGHRSVAQDLDGVAGGRPRSTSVR
jgi:hypothetical protein